MPSAPAVNETCGLSGYGVRQPVLQKKVVPRTPNPTYNEYFHSLAAKPITSLARLPWIGDRRSRRARIGCVILITRDNRALAPAIRDIQ
jgi:hypothetical protein